ncbi:hypothetical protein E2562_031526 [Oryza meyeriana var. granulata]|uniref:Uncharacterized protein n=1 Tax=Oryza meyeriana var. granulata TaxID=110450 RepID=A0A6G1DQL9_9ORYZ|nr:hypothetical protein E2562_031526 [Oryza meyeriana var. granulata]
MLDGRQRSRGEPSSPNRCHASCMRSSGRAVVVAGRAVCRHGSSTSPWPEQGGLAASPRPPHHHRFYLAKSFAHQRRQRLSCRGQGSALTGSVLVSTAPAAAISWARWATGRFLVG